MLNRTIKTQLMGIINCTPDSYFEGGRFTDPEKAIAYGLQLLNEGADLLDIGGESTRPLNSQSISAKEEIARVVPVIKGLRAETNLPLSIDTFKPEVAEAALEAGATMINDITSFCHPAMRRLAAASHAQLCVMHMLGSPHTCPTPDYPEGVIAEIRDFFLRQVDQLLNAGVETSKIILDPGIGGGAFGKTPEQSLEILSNLSVFKELGFPLLIGISRKSFMQKILQKRASELLSTTVALNTMAVQEGVDYIRVHDVQAHRDILTVLKRMAEVNVREYHNTVC